MMAMAFKGFMQSAQYPRRKDGANTAVREREGIH